MLSILSYVGNPADILFGGTYSRACFISFCKVFDNKLIAPGKNEANVIP